MEPNNLKSKKGDNGKYGYVDESGNWVVEPKFWKVDEFERGVARVQVDGMWGFLNEDGSWLFEPVLHEADSFSNEVARVRKGFFYGFINRKGEWVIEPKLLEAWPFEGDSVTGIFNSDNVMAFISNNGKMITDFNLEGLVSYNVPAHFMYDNRIRAKKDEKYGFLNLNGTWVIPPNYKRVREFSEERAFVNKKDNNEDYDLIDVDGNILMKSIEPVYKFKNGMAIVKKPLDRGERDVYYTYKAGVIDKDGNWIIPPQYDEINEFNNGLAVIQDNGKKGVINVKGEIIIPIEYKNIIQEKNYINIIDSKNKEGLADKQGKVIFPPKFESCWLTPEGFVIIKKKSRYGLADLEGNVLFKPILVSIPPSFGDRKNIKVETAGRKYGWIDRKGELLGDKWFDGTNDFSDGLAAIKMNDLWGFINQDGELVIEPQFDEVSDFKNGLNVVSISNHWGLIDKKGDWIVEPIFDEIKEFADGIASAKIFIPKRRSSKWGFINVKGEFVIDPEFDDLENFVGDFAKAKSNGHWGMIDRHWNWVVSPEYDELKILKDSCISAMIKKNGLTGIINKAGKIIVEPKYEYIKNFSEAGVAEIGLKKKKGFINQEGKEIVPLIIDKFGNWDPTFARWVKVDKKWGVLDYNEGRWLIEPIYEDLIECYNSPFFNVKYNGKWGKIDIQGKLLSV